MEYFSNLTWRGEANRKLVLVGEIPPRIRPILEIDFLIFISKKIGCS